MIETEVAFERFTRYVKEVEFLNYEFVVELKRGNIFLRAKYLDEDTYTGKQELQLTRRWTLNPASTQSEVIQAAFKCVMTSMEHRAREGFKFRGRRVFGPHFDVNDLWTLCGDRENAGGRDFTHVWQGRADDNPSCMRCGEDKDHINHSGPDRWAGTPGWLWE